MNAAVYHLNFKTGKMEPMSAAHLLPVGSLISYEDMANPRQKAVVTGETAGEWGYGQACTFEDGHASQVHASDPDRHGRRRSRHRQPALGWPKRPHSAR